MAWPLVCTPFATMATLAHAADWSTHSTFQLGMAVDSNPRMLDEAPRSAASSLAHVAAGLSRQTETARIDVDATASAYRYGADAALDRSDRQLALQMSRRGERYSLGSGINLTWDTTLTSELGTTGITEYNQRHRARAVSLAPQWQLTPRFSTRLALGWQDSSYAHAVRGGLSGYDYTYVGTTSEFIAGPATRASLALSVGRLDSTRYHYDTDNIDLRFSLVHAWSQRWTGSISGGPSRVRADGRRSSGSVFGGTLSRRAELFSLDASVERSTSPSGSGLLSRKDEITFGSTVSLAEQVTASASLGMIRSRDIMPGAGFAAARVSYARAGASLGWNLARGWNLSMSAGDARQRVADGTARNLDARLSFSWSPRG